MTRAEPFDGQTASADVLGFVPELRTDFARQDVAGECVVWSPSSSDPTVLDAVATLMLDVIDGTASISDLATEVHEEIGIPLETAQRQVTLIVERFDQAQLLTTSTPTSTAQDTIERRDLFVGGSTPCSEEASRVGTVTLWLRFGQTTLRVACDSRRGARKLRDALAEHIVSDADDTPLGFVLTAPQGLQRHHRLVDRTGFVLSEGRGLDPGIQALASHLTALLPPVPGTVRIRARAVVAGDRTVVCLFPHLFFPEVEDRELIQAGLRVIDRLALDIDVATGEVAHAAMPWPALEKLGHAPAHVGTGGRRRVDAVVDAIPSKDALPSTRAAVVGQVAASGLAGSIDDLLSAANLLVEGAELRSVPAAPNELTDTLVQLARLSG
jgi:hypothetical protein